MSTSVIAIRFGRRIAAQRRRLGWTAGDLAAKSGVSQELIYRLEGAAGGCRLDSAAPIAAALGISLDRLGDPCERCGDKPDAGFTCNSCGAGGEEPTP